MTTTPTTPEEIAAIAKIAEQVRWQVISDPEWRPKNALEASAVAGLLVHIDAATARIETEEARADAATQIITNAATILREIAVENDVLVATRTWEHDGTLVARPPVASARVDELRTHLEEMRDAASNGIALPIDTTDLQDIETTLQWFNATRNALVHMHKNQLDYQLYGVQLDSRSVESQLVHSALVHVMQEAAKRKAVPTMADLAWVLSPVERLRNGADLDFVPPLARDDAASEPAGRMGEFVDPAKIGAAADEWLVEDELWGDRHHESFLAGAAAYVALLEATATKEWGIKLGRATYEPCDSQLQAVAREEQAHKYLDNPDAQVVSRHVVRSPWLPPEGGKKP